MDTKEMMVRIVAAFLLGSLIGLEREIRGKEAGFKTNALVCLGSAVYMVLSLQIFSLYREAAVDPSRIAAQVVTGIGFLGGGAIIRFREGVKGLTTAAGIWVAAAIGLACGLGQYLTAVVGTLLTMVVLVVFPKAEDFLRRKFG